MSREEEEQQKAADEKKKQQNMIKSKSKRKKRKTKKIPIKIEQNQLTLDLMFVKNEKPTLAVGAPRHVSDAILQDYVSGNYWNERDRTVFF